MMIKARKLKESEVPGKTDLYEVRKSCNIMVEEKQDDNSLDQVIMEYHMEDNEIGFFAKEYRPEDVPKMGAKVIDITAAIMNHEGKYIRWHLYDIKDTLAGKKTVTTLFSQWYSGLRYLQKNILDRMPEYSVTSDLGVITRCYDEERMRRLRNDAQRQCDEIESFRENMTLSQRKKRTDIAKYRGILKAAQAILDKKFEAENGIDTYKIQIRHLLSENDKIYRMRFPV